MRRTLAMIVAGLTMVGLVVAILPAQESVPWKRPGTPAKRAVPANPPGSVYGEAATSQASEPGQFPMEAAQNLHAAAPDSDIIDDNVRQAQLRRRSKFQDRRRGSEELTQPNEAPPTAEETSQHSILKRNATSTDESTLSPQKVSPVHEPGATPPGGTSSRRAGRPTLNPLASGGVPTIPSRVTDLHVTSSLPVIRMELIGPGAMQVGQSTKYTIYANNDGDSAAHDVIVRLPLPSSVNLTKGESTAGDAEVHTQTDGQLELVWSIPSLAARRHETLHMELVANEGEACELALTWTCQPATASARIVVKQPQLALSLTGPGDMLLGEEKDFTLLVANPGTGDATGVELNISLGAGVPQRVEVGTIPAGEETEIPVQVVASQAGELEIKATAKADGDLSADAGGKVLIRSAELAVAVDAPQLKFAGSEATYVIVVANRGNAPADATSMIVQLPEGARYIGGVDGAGAGKGSLKWNAGMIPPGAEKSFEVRAELLTEGANRLVAHAETGHGISGEAEAVTEVQAVADLKLVVNDPSGPSPVGQEVAYDIQVKNQGTRAASQVKVLMQFGQGIEPTGMEGGKGKIVPGQILFEPIASLGAGEQVTLKVMAKAEEAGTHQFRVEVTTREDGIRLVSEGTNRYFTESRGGIAQETRPSAATAARPQVPTPAKTKQR